MGVVKLNPCRICGGSDIVIETWPNWSSGEKMHMVKCNNPDCPVPDEGYPSGRSPDEVKAEWNRRNTTK